MTKKIFISYSDNDRSRMRSLEKIIDNSTHFKPIIIADRRDALIALTEKVKTGIFESDYVVPLLTEKSINSQWVNQEIGYAAALNKTIIPIIEKEIVESLKGFIHKNIDLPYEFSENKSNPKATRTHFRKACNLVINDLLLVNNFKTKGLELENIFPGQWQSEFDAPHIKGTEPGIEIKEGNKYFVDGKHWFDIQNFKISSDQKRITFTKYGLGEDKRIIFNDLKVLKLGEVYTGFELEKLDNKKIAITYARIK